MENRKANRNRAKERFRRYMERRRRLRENVRRHGADILRSDNFKSTHRFMQHGRVSVHQHSLRVAECSLRIEHFFERLGIRFQEKEMVRGALLHDYFLYDWHDKHSHKRLHGFHHPAVALANASREYPLTLRERDIIAKHMWPLTVKPPLCREAWIVTAADKYCSLRETLLERRRRRP
ncbi:MAG: HD domain-containing protein [Eubacteriales bacterium]|nr:HD domain-containing protein [Eubacteriales bacterium]